MLEEIQYASRMPLFVCLAGFVLIIGCGGKTSTSPTSPTPSRAEFSATDIRIGTGTEATSGHQVLVNYTGWLYDSKGTEQKGSQFDSSVTAGRTPLMVVLGGGGVIAGFDRGIVGMRVGGLRRVIIPPELGYGSQGSPPSIPGNATLVFDIELLQVN